MYIDVHIPNYERHILHHMDISKGSSCVVWKYTFSAKRGNIAAQIWDECSAVPALEGWRYAASVVLTAYVRTSSLRARDITYTLENYRPVDSNSNMWKYVPDSKDYPILSGAEKVRV